MEAFFVGVLLTFLIELLICIAKAPPQETFWLAIITCIVGGIVWVPIARIIKD